MLTFPPVQFRYCLSISILASVYSALQLLKGIHDIAFRGRYISDNKCDKITFFMDQVDNICDYHYHFFSPNNGRDAKLDFEHIF